MIIPSGALFDRFGSFRIAAGVEAQPVFGIVDKSGAVSDLTGRSIVWRFLDEHNVVVGTPIAASVNGATATFAFTGALTESLRTGGVAGFEIAMLTANGRVVLHRGAASIDDAAPFLGGVAGAPGTDSLTVLAAAGTLIISAQGAPGSSTEALAAAALANTAAGTAQDRATFADTAGRAANAAAVDSVAKTALAVTATGEANTATAAAKAATTDSVAKTALAVTATAAATAGATAANTAAAQIVPEGGPSLLIKPGTGTFPAIADTYFTGRKSLYSNFDGLRRQLRGFSDVADVTRATTATYFDAAGVLQTATVGMARLGYRFITASSTWVLAGLLVEAQATNFVINSVADGAVAGTPGTAPTSWNIIGSINGITRQIVGTGVSNGIPYIDIRFSGTATANGNVSIYPQNYPAAVGQTWTGSVWAALVAGALPTPTTSFVEVVNEIGPDASYYTTNPFNPTAQFTRRPLSRTMVNATTNRTQHYLQQSYATGASFDYTIRLGGWQMEQGSSASSLILTTTAQATRSPDFLSKAVGPEFNPVSQTMLLRARWEGALRASRIGGWDGGSDNDRIIVDLTSAGNIIARVMIGGIAAGQVNGPMLVVGTDYKIAIGFTGTTLRLVVNGTAYADAALTALPPITTRRFGNNGASGSQPNFFIMPYLAHPTNPLLDATEFPRLLSVAEMQAYTA